MKAGTHGERRYAAVVPILIALIVIMFAELFVFNLAHWRTLSHAPASAGDITIGAGLQDNGDGTYTITNTDESWIDVFLSSPDHSGSKPRVESIRIVPSSEKPSDKTATVTHYQLFTRNEANDWVNISYGNWHNPATENLTYCAGSPSTQYMLTPGPNTDAIRILFTDAQGTIVPFSHVEPNVTVPLTICWQRIVAMMLVAALVLMFRPASRLYAIGLAPYDGRRRIRLIGMTANALLLCLLFVALCCISGDITHAYATRTYNDTFNHWMDLNQYQQLGDALLHGRLNLDLPVDPHLTAMDNPYDYYQRSLLGKSGAIIFWDHAFYDGKYYMYFGALPAVLLFAPYQALTGQWLPSPVAVMIFGVLFIAALAALLYRLAVRYFPDASFGAVLLAFNLATLGCGTVYFGFQPDFYAIPFIASLMFTTLGLLLWTTARRPDGGLSTLHIMGGSFLIACNLGCRPQFLIACLLAFPLFWDEIVHTRELFSLHGLRNTICAFVPFIVVAVPWMLYNAARFGSPFDIGSAYNLTGYDATRLKPSPLTLPALLFIQLLQPASVNADFPFVHAIGNDLAAPTEPSLGGYFVIAPFAVLGFLFFLLRGTLRRRHAYGLAATLAACSALTMLFDTWLAGTSNRYHGDFAWMASLLGVIVLYAIDAHVARFDEPTRTTTDVAQARTLFRALMLLMLLWSAFIYITGCFAPERYDPLIAINPDLYYTVKSWFLGLYAF